MEGGLLNYPKYDNEIYSIVQYVKKWKHYLMGKETIIHTDHQSLQYLLAQSKLQHTMHYKCMGFLQQLHLIIKYKKDNTNKSIYMLSRSPISNITALGTLIYMEPSYMMHTRWNTHTRYFNSYMSNSI